MNARWILPSILIGLAGVPAGRVSLQAAINPAALPPAATAIVDFGRDIAPLRADRCVQCHGPRKQESGLRLDEPAAAMAGGEHGPLLVPGKSADSLIVAVLAGAHSELAQMPKKGDKLTPGEVGLIRAWIDQGAGWPAGATADAAAQTRRDHWAWKPPVRPVMPAGAPAGIHPIDAFIQARLPR